jgi:hypothetical protein
MQEHILNQQLSLSNTELMALKYLNKEDNKENLHKNGKNRA